jgi:hypothetical protein
VYGLLSIVGAMQKSYAQAFEQSVVAVSSNGIEKLSIRILAITSPTVPIVYSVSFNDSAGYFLATKMQMHNKDVIFAANAQAVEITKFAAFVNTLISVPSNIGALGITWQSLRIISGSGPASSGAAVVTTPVVVSSPPH